MNNIPLQLNEEIRYIRGYEGLYSITSFGRVWSYERLDSIGRRIKGRFLKSLLENTGYLHINLYREGKKDLKRIHILVATHFIPNPQNLPEVNHKDGDKLNCCKDNLEWCTNQENKNHAMVKKLYKYKKTSEYHGVTFRKRRKEKKNPWAVFITFNKKRKYLGSFSIEIKAAEAYNAFILKHNLDRPLNKIGN